MKVEPREQEVFSYHRYEGVLKRTAIGHIFEAQLTSLRGTWHRMGLTRKFGWYAQ